MHGLLQRIKLLLLNHEADLEVIWIPTETMAGQHLADQPSRGIFTLSDVGLSVKGANKFKSLFKDFSDAVAKNKAVSLFSSPSSNPFKISYCSLDYDLTDPFCLRTCGFQALSAGLSHKFDAVFAFPAPAFCDWFIHAVVHSNWVKKQTVYVLIHSEFLSPALIEFSRLGVVEKRAFSGKRNKSMFTSNPGSSYTALCVKFF